jgi:hypothetical protein
MEHYLFCVTETPPPPEVEREESASERRDREAARLDVPPARPGDDPPTYGDEGGGTLYPERALQEAPGRRRPTLLQRLLLRLHRPR